MEVAVSVAGKVMDLLFGVVKKKISYMWYYSENVKTFKEEVEKLNALKATLEQRIHVAKGNGEDPGKDLENWMESADVKIFEATTFITEEDESKKTCCNVRFCINLGTLYHYGRMATKKTSSLLQHKIEGEPFKHCVFNPLPDPGVLDLYQIKDLENIDTQKSSLKKIIQAIKDLQIVGIVGLGGVGKTTLAKEVAAQMKNQFDHVEFIAISQTIDAKKIKEEVQVAAKRIMNGEKVLIILDDVWEVLKLDEVGIPCGTKYTNCKILLTSRIEDVCMAINSQKIISVNPLPKQEAWTLFERVIGEREWDNRLKKVALDIVKECKGLPLFIQAVGKALKYREARSWEAALHRLQDPTDENDEYKRKGIAQLKLSYDYLEGKVARSCFLLCSMFPEDGIIDIERLTHYGLALGIYDNPDCNFQKAKDEVQGALESLKLSFLLLCDGRSNEGGLFKLHDLVRDMAILIASKGDDMFWVQSGKGLTEWQLRKDLESYKKISLMRNKICKLPDHELHFPHLDTFLIQNNELSDVPDEFFRGMEKLKVLDMSFNSISSLPRSLEQLSELIMLDLSCNYSVCEISILGKLTCLEILQLAHTKITNIPKEIGQLTKLRLLDLSNTSLCEISILGKLTCLEILKLRFTRITNIPEEIGQLTKLRLLDLTGNQSLCEISILGKLTCLEILKLRNTGIKNIPKEIKQLTKLRLLDVDYCKDLSSVKPGVISKLIRLEELYLGLTKEGKCEFLGDLNQLKSLIILHLSVPDLHYIPQDFHYENLIEFQISDASYMRPMDDYRRNLVISEFKLLFTMPITKIIQLSEGLKLNGIKDLNNILPSLYRVDGFDDELKYIELVGCKNVRRLVETCELGPMKTQGKLFFSKVEEITLSYMDSLEVLWDSPHPYISFSNLAKIIIEHCHSLSELFPFSVAQGLVNLKTLQIRDCKSLVVVISAGDEQTSGSQVEETCGIEIKQTSGNKIEQTTGGSEIEVTSTSKTDLVKHDRDDIIFPFLTHIHLDGLPKLASFYSGHSTIKYPSLQRVEAIHCPNMKRWSYGDNDIPKIKFIHQKHHYCKFVQIEIREKLIIPEQCLWSIDDVPIMEMLLD